MRFSKLYAAACLSLFAIEFAIAVWVDDAFVRPYVGDALVVPLVYCAVMAIYEGRPVRVLLGAFALACAVEFAQLARAVDRLHITNPILRVIIGTTFEPLDLVAYACGAVLVAFCERARRA